MFFPNLLGFPYMPIDKGSGDFIFIVLSWKDKIKGQGKRGCMRKDKNHIKTSMKV